MDRAEFDRELAAFDEVMHRLNQQHLALADGDPQHHVILVEREIHIYRMEQIMDQYYSQDHMEND